MLHYPGTLVAVMPLVKIHRVMISLLTTSVFSPSLIIIHMLLTIVNFCHELDPFKVICCHCP